MIIPQSLQKSKKLSLVVFATLFVLAIVLRVFHLDRSLGGDDENAMLLYFGYSPLKVIISNYWETNNHIFHTVLVRLMGFWFGEENSIAIRFPTLLFGLASLWVIYSLALELFNSKLIAITALLIATVNPIHIHYSHTARGYGLIIFFSAAMALLTIKIFRSEKFLLSGILITICGFLSVYTIPTNVYFLIGLGGWVFSVFIIPDPNKIFFKNKNDRKIKCFVFIKITIAITILCFIVYGPLLSQILETIRKTTFLNPIRAESDWNSVTVLIPEILARIFPGKLLIFLPLIVISYFYKNSLDHSHKSLPLFIIFLPFIILLIIGVGGYPRNYLYNFPILIILMAAGMATVGNLCGQLFKNTEVARWVTLGICLSFCLLSINTLFNKYYPSLEISKGKEYRKNILLNTQSNDLIAVQSTQNYLYARKAHLEKLINILNDNRLGRFNLITPMNYDLFDYDPVKNRKIFSVIKQLWSSINFKKIVLDENNKMTVMTKKGSKSILKEQFEETTQWKVFRGKGTVSKLKMPTTHDQMALKLETSPENEMIVIGSVPGQVSVLKPSIVVLVWTVAMNYNEMIMQPLIAVKVATPNGPKTVQVNMGRINEGMNTYVSYDTGLFSSSDWFLRSSIGVIPPGSYDFSILLKANKGQKVVYDEFRLFTIELADNK
jgi:4-amino-4-deoxy-L-arabinose transferase-like glycosyltransferase